MTLFIVDYVGPTVKCCQCIRDADRLDVRGVRYIRKTTNRQEMQIIISRIYFNSSNIAKRMSGSMEEITLDG